MTNTTQNFPIEEQQSRVKQAFVGLQMLFVAFGALVLVPLITGLDANTALLTAGVGTLLFQLCKNSWRGSIRTYFSTSGRWPGHYHHWYGISPCGRGYGIR